MNLWLLSLCGGREGNRVLEIAEFKVLVLDNVVVLDKSDLGFLVICLVGRLVNMQPGVVEIWHGIDGDL